MLNDHNDTIRDQADSQQAAQWREMLDREIDEVSAAIEAIEKRALAEHRAGAVDRARRFDSDSEKLRIELKELHRMRRNLTDRFA
ncbi:hypothetical protein HCA61_24255 [Rhodococcus sp. HNM0563]|uniref:hypothetical protein n=1 Tax=unclassified Rhodococcus (in: high G+C Gram-positive bacteria) TaxID=192944 RepID=UPI00146BA612|nr:MULTISPECIES: hypothetical protein [unclassified Rhodococcus (in: high G+C Gram-positive bacteria)]MCK0093629.1 hypothetical protein [Rhodococcus sp. F64268]NLU65344.1 hypothetical protein [Rhodococcus sp. HNM0563]